MTEASILIAALVCIVLVSSADQWQPLNLVIILGLFTVAGDLMTVQSGQVRASGVFAGLMLSVALLGPAPAAAFAMGAMLIDAVHVKPKLEHFLRNLLAYSLVPLLGGLLYAVVAERWQLDFADWQIMVLIAGLYFALLISNFFLILGPQAYIDNERLLPELRSQLVTVLPNEVVGACLTIIVLEMYSQWGTPALLIAVVGLFIHGYLVDALLRSKNRGELLRRRGEELATFHVGLLSTLLRTLSLRDKMTARHSAAVARYARAIATAYGCSEEEQGLVHTAGLVHDIGKFIFPDDILFATSKLSDEQWAVIKRHPGVGADLLSEVDGFEPIAEVVRSHHERIDGNGYPDGLAAEEIPLLSRCISVADTFDVMTARDSYREPRSTEEAIAELRRVSGSQLDATLVEIFIRLVEDGQLGFVHGDDADFEAELNLELEIKLAGMPKDE